MEEIWKPIPGFEGLYEASSLGRFRGVARVITLHKKTGDFLYHKKGKTLKQTLDGRGLYLQVTLSKNGDNRKYLSHRIVAMTFIDNPFNLPEVNHKDENKTNNSVENLEWCDHKYNNNYGSKLHKTRGENNPQNKFSEDVIREARRLFIPGDPKFGMMGLAKKYGISPSHMTAILKGRRWGWLD